VLWAVLGALVGGILLNLMPCVFPILALKALHLSKAGGEAREARSDALAYAAGAVVGTGALGVALLAIRAAGAEAGWAFQLQDPRTIMLLLLLAVAITANLLGLFELPVLAERAERPTAVLSSPATLVARASAPMAVLPKPVMLPISAPQPLAVFSLPVVLASSVGVKSPPFAPYALTGLPSSSSSIRATGNGCGEVRAPLKE